MAKYKCIYCLENKPATLYEKTEHVIPQSFGLFENNFTLNNIVCDDCNQFFGDNLEIDLARDTFEGLQRFGFGVKENKDYKSIGKKSRMMIRITEDGLLNRAYAFIEYSAECQNIILKPVPQVGFKKYKVEEYEYFFIDKIPNGKYIEENFDLSHHKSIQSFGVDIEIVRKKLSEKGIPFTLGGETLSLVGGNILCEIEGKIDSIIKRAVAKIGFNYLACWHCPDFIQQKSFDIIRRYIRYGETTDHSLVDISEQAILADEGSCIRRLGHIVKVNWAADKVSIVGHVSLFNWITYSISLSREYLGKHREVKKGHFFNICNQRILEIGTK